MENQTCKYVPPQPPPPPPFRVPIMTAAVELTHLWALLIAGVYPTRRKSPLQLIDRNQPISEFLLFPVCVWGKRKVLEWDAKAETDIRLYRRANTKPMLLTGTLFAIFFPTLMVNKVACACWEKPDGARNANASFVKYSWYEIWVGYVDRNSTASYILWPSSWKRTLAKTRYR